LLLRARAERISEVCGKEPMVVVGSGGRCRASSWAASRTGYSERVKSAGVRAFGAGADLGAADALGGWRGRR
jgi:hypothetical protein